MKTLAFFNNKGGVGKTTLVYHIAWTLHDLGVRVLVADLDPQANLSSMCIAEERLAALWPDGPHPHTVSGAVSPILRGVGDINTPYIEEIEDSFGLLVGDLGLSQFEDKLSLEWPRCADGKEDAFRVTTAFYRLLKQAAKTHNSDLVIIDVGPNLGAINRSALLCAKHIIVPLQPDLYSLQGLKNLGPTLQTWRKEWKTRKKHAPKNIPCPSGKMKPAGYVVLQHNVRYDRPVKAYAQWANRIPTEYLRSVLHSKGSAPQRPTTDPHCLGLIRHYRSLVPMAMEARKPIFHLTAADGALGAHRAAATQCGEDFRQLTNAIAAAIRLNLP